jgi:hypothetical protein
MLPGRAYRLLSKFKSPNLFYFAFGQALVSDELEFTSIHMRKVCFENF